MPVQTKDMRSGILFAVSAYVLWGFLPMFWKLLDDVNPMEVLAHRIIWSFLFMIVLLLAIKQFRSFLDVCRNIIRKRKDLIGITIAALVISLNWFVFIWAVANEHVLQASLGYYINPLVSIFLGIIILREKVDTRQTLAFILCIVGVLYLTFSAGIFPWISLILAFSFGIYGLLKKKVDINATHGLALETMIVTPLALIYLLFLPEHTFTLATDFAIASTNLLLIASGLATAIPLLLFAKGAKSIPLSMVGILQFINPTIIFILGVFVYREPFSMENLIAFLFIWFAVFLYLSLIYQHPAKKRANV